MCRSAQTLVIDNQLHTYPCLIEGDHTGECANGPHRWTRLGEEWRERGIVGFPRRPPMSPRGEGPASLYEPPAASQRPYIAIGGWDPGAA